MMGMDINTMASWVSVIAMAVWPVLITVGRRVLRHLVTMEKELNHNGGSSIKDAVSRIETSLEELKKDTKRNHKQVKKLKGELEAHLADLGE